MKPHPDPPQGEGDVKSEEFSTPPAPSSLRGGVKSDLQKNQKMSFLDKTFCMVSAS